MLVNATVISGFDVLIALTVISAAMGAAAMTTTADFKKVIANFSIVHMSLALLISLNLNSQVFQALIFSWNHHSVVTGLNFFFVGVIYAFSACRLFRFVVPGGFITNPVLTVLFLGIMTLTNDFP